MNKFFTSDEVYNDRLAICKECIYYYKPTGQCKRCLCFMKIKARIAPMACPEKYWNKTTTIEVPKGLPEELIEEVIKVYPDIKNGRAKNQEVKRKAIELYNTIYATNYSTGTNCSSCLSSVLNGIKDIYNKYGG
tara:strand:+ start:13356 stop:13757 length:402 start_codon:yes stop_codon:yes gene_type:complete